MSINKTYRANGTFIKQEQTQDIPYLKMIAFDLNKEKSNKVAAIWYGNECENAYSILYRKIREFLQSRGFEKVQGSVYKNNTPITKSDAENVLADLKKTFPWISYCMQNCNISDIRISYDVTKALSGDIKEQAVFESSVMEYRNNTTRKVINFDLIDTKNIPNYSNAVNFKLIPGFIQNGYEHVQQTGYVSNETKTTLQCYADFKKIIDSVPRVKSHIQNATITEVIRQYDGKDFMKISVKDIAKNKDQIDYSFYENKTKEKNEQKIYDNLIRRMTAYYTSLGKDANRIRKDIDTFLDTYDYKTETLPIGLEHKGSNIMKAKQAFLEKEDKTSLTFRDVMEDKTADSSKPHSKRGRKKKEDMER